ncbi:MAG: glycosyltransferase [Vicingaceae bacterium]|nr:glycosyltransferase [Vicingaceae bacterium]
MSTSQNICFFNTTPFWGGGEKWHFEAAQNMSKTTNKTFFVCDGKGELAKKLKETNVVQQHVTAGNLSFLNPTKINKLVQFYKVNKIDTVIFNNPKDLKLGGRAAKKAGVKNIVYRRGIAVEVKKSRLNTHLFADVVTHFIFNSNATKELLEKNYKNIVATKKTAIIYNAIDFPKNPITHNPSPTTQIIIGNAGRLVEQKAQRFLIDIAEKLKEKNLEFKILIAGDGPLHDELKQSISDRKLNENIELLGFVDDVPNFMAGVDLFVSTAIWEGFGFVLAEAMMAKKPVLAFDMSSNPELVKDGKNGFLVPPKNIDVFADKIQELIGNEILRKKMGEEAYRFAESNFETKKQFQKLLDFIH